MSRAHFETDDATFPADAYRVARSAAVAWHVLGWETEPDEDTEWSGEEARTGFVLCVMIGDDHRHRVDPDDLTPIEREDYCGECGQIGCGHDGLDRTEAQASEVCRTCGELYHEGGDGYDGECPSCADKRAAEAQS